MGAVGEGGRLTWVTSQRMHQEKQITGFFYILEVHNTRACSDRRLQELATEGTSGLKMREPDCIGLE
jgi:hypothetical protein